MPRLLIATQNTHKTEEIRAVLAGWEISDLTAYPHLRAPEETGSTFAENAEIKAQAAARYLSGWVLADDSGLQVDVLGGEPGVRSARYAGSDASDAQNRARLLEALRGCGQRPPYTARFRCAMVLAEGEQVLGTFEGVVDGTLLEEERGAGGFGYDSLFVPAGFGESFGELPPTVKNQLSHRARALALVRSFLKSRTQ